MGFLSLQMDCFSSSLMLFLLYLVHQLSSVVLFLNMVYKTHFLRFYVRLGYQNSLLKLHCRDSQMH